MDPRCRWEVEDHEEPWTRKLGEPSCISRVDIGSFEQAAARGEYTLHAGDHSVEITFRVCEWGHIVGVTDADAEFDTQQQIGGRAWGFDAMGCSFVDTQNALRRGGLSHGLTVAKILDFDGQFTKGQVLVSNLHCKSRTLVRSVEGFRISVFVNWPARELYFSVAGGAHQLAPRLLPADVQNLRPWVQTESKYASVKIQAITIHSAGPPPLPPPLPTPAAVGPSGEAGPSTAPPPESRKRRKAAALPAERKQQRCASDDESEDDDEARPWEDSPLGAPRRGQNNGEQEEEEEEEVIEVQEEEGEEGEAETEMKEEEELSEAEQAEYGTLRKAYLEERAPGKNAARSAPQRAAQRGLLPPRILSLVANREVCRRAKRMLDRLHRIRQYNSALVLLRSVRDYQKTLHMPMPGILRDPTVENLEVETPIDLTGNEKEPDRSRVIIDLEILLEGISSPRST